MNKTVLSLVAAAIGAAAVSAEASSTPSPTPTNVVDFLNVQLEFTSLTDTTTNYATNIITHETSKVKTTVTNIVTNIVFTSVSTAVTTSDLIGVLTTNTAPSGSSLARVRETNGTSYLAIRHSGTNVVVLDGQVVFANSLQVPVPKPQLKEQLTTSGKTIKGSADELVTFDITTPTLSLSGKGFGTRTWTGDSFTIGSTSLPDITESVNVAGVGVDASGTNEIVIGTVTVGGDTLGN
jgi:hypothetical protein